MPEERDIEKQLRAAAAERRQAAGGPFALHPATRRLLQGEVARTRQAAESARGKVFFGLTWLRFASGVCTVSILCFGTWVWLRNAPPAERPSAAMSPGSEKVLALKSEPMAFEQRGATPSKAAEKQKDEPRLVAPTAAPKPSQPIAPAKPASEEALQKSRATSGSEVARFDVATSVDRLAVADSRGKAAAADSDTLRERDETAARETPAPTSAGSLALNAPATPGAVFAAGGKANPVAAQNYAYRNEPISGRSKKVDDSKLEVAAARALTPEVKRQATALPAAKVGAMLANFKISQTGDRIRIEDSDGSVYEGVLLAETAFADAAAPDATPKENAPARTAVTGTLSATAAAESSTPATSDAVGDRGNTAYTFSNARIADQGLAADLAAGGVRFNAAGTNVALRQNVVITGTFVNDAPTDREGFSTEATRRLQLRDRAALVPQSRIVGRAVTADGREIQLNAAPVGQ